MEAGEAQAPTIMGNYPIVENIHQKVYDAANAPDALDMNTFHSCGTKHCRAGWALHLAGEQGYKLEAHTDSVFAAMMIFKTSSPNVPVSPVRFFEDNATALEDMRKCAELEKTQTTTP